MNSQFDIEEHRQEVEKALNRAKEIMAELEKEVEKTKQTIARLNYLKLRRQFFEKHIIAKMDFPKKDY